MYLTVVSRSDIAHTVVKLAQFATCSERSHCLAAKRVLRSYLKGIADLGRVSAISQKQRTVALSSMETEYASLTEAAKKTIYLPIIYVDNQGAQYLANDPMYHARTKHIDIKHHFIREVVKRNEIVLKHIYLPTKC
ncbi:hypothetical protein ACFW04_006550 [Cataglyphis niger]